MKKQSHLVVLLFGGGSSGLGLMEEGEEVILEGGQYFVEKYTVEQQEKYVDEQVINLLY